LADQDGMPGRPRTILHAGHGRRKDGVGDAWNQDADHAAHLAHQAPADLAWLKPELRDRLLHPRAHIAARGPGPLTTRLTVAIEHRARAATWRMVTEAGMREPLKTFPQSGYVVVLTDDKPATAFSVIYSDDGLWRIE
jgi:hypothetical protein